MSSRPTRPAKPKASASSRRPNAQPLIESESVAFVISTSATLEAQLNPNYREATYLFEYATEESVLLEGNGTKVPGGTLPVGNSGQTVRAKT